jgi:hypothetical protein
MRPIGAQNRNFSATLALNWWVGRKRLRLSYLTINFDLVRMATAAADLTSKNKPKNIFKINFLVLIMMMMMILIVMMMMMIK